MTHQLLQDGFGSEQNIFGFSNRHCQYWPRQRMGKLGNRGINFCPDKIYSELYIFYIVKFYAFEKELRAAN